MLEHLEIRNFALIENLSMDFSTGFNVITGETGAGKSIILGALGLLMGEKADASSVRTGADEIVVNAVVSVPENHEIRSYLEERSIEVEDDQIVINRTVRTNGKSLIRVQGTAVTRSELAFIADSLIDMHGQSEHQSLLIPEAQRKIVDSYASNSVLLNECSLLYHRLCDLKKKKEELERLIEEGRRTEDYLNFALEEINSAKIRAGEDEELKEKVSVLSNYSVIYENLSAVSEKLHSLKSSFYDAQSLCQKAAKSDSKLNELCARIESSRIETEDIAQTIGEYLGSVSYSEEEINQMQERIALIQKIKRKYGPSMDDVFAFAEDAQVKLDTANNSEVHLAQCDKEIKQVCDAYSKVSSSLSSRRKLFASELDKKIEDTLKTLGMPNAKFKINVSYDAEKISPTGNDIISFFISANPGEPEKELREIASGGELSRVMLALKTVLAKADSIQTQIFDEIDSGIGGAVALNLASCICDLSKTKQVLAITHLASIAGKADTHFAVSKTVENGRTYSHIKEIKGEARVLEIARMLSGDESEVSLEHARKILGC